MDGMEQRLESILSDPSSMEKIMELAKNLGINPPDVPSGEPDAVPNSTAPVQTSSTVMDGIPNMASLGALLSAMGGQGKDDKQTMLLKALRPYLRPERQDRLDRAIQAARLVKAAKQAMRQFSL